MGCFAGDFFAVGNRRHSVYFRFFPRSCRARIRSAFCRDGPSSAAGLFLSATSVAQICPLERANDRGGDRRDAFAVFGRKVRHEAEARQWRCEVVSAKDEGLLLYLRKTHFIEPDRAQAEWNDGNLDALVVSTEKAPAVMPQLQGAAVSQLKSNQARDGRETGYVLITRSGFGAIHSSAYAK